jgi:hypothetical protein
MITQPSQLIRSHESGDRLMSAAYPQQQHVGMPGARPTLVEVAHQVSNNPGETL